VSPRRRWAPVSYVLPALLLLTVFTPIYLAGPARAAVAGVDPGNASAELAPGESTDVPATVHTPTVPARPDIVLLVDGTGSMDGPIGDVQRNLPPVLRQVQTAQPDAQFAVATYGDAADGSRAFQVLQSLTKELGDVDTGIANLSTDRGNNSPSEDWINALVQVAGHAAGTFRPGANPIVVLIGDASSHDPSLGHTLPEAISALRDQKIKVVAIGLHDAIGDGLNGNGRAGSGNTGGDPPHDANQATAVTDATNGKFIDVPDNADRPGQITPGEVAAAVLAGLTNLPSDVSQQVTSCDPGLSLSVDPATSSVLSGTDASFHEHLTVAPDARQGATLRCVVQYSVTDVTEDGANPPDPALAQTISVHVRDVTAPVVTLDDRIVTATGPGGAVVTYPVTATDGVDGLLVPTCAPPSGSLFPVGTSTVTCTATDAAGNTGRATASFTVLSPSPAPSDDLRVVSVTTDPNPGFAGVPVTVTVTVANAGPRTATGVVVAVALPPGARSVGAQSACTAAAPCTIPSGTRVLVRIPVTYGSAFTGTVRATVNGRLPDLRPANNVGRTGLTVTAPTLRVTPAVAEPGKVAIARGGGFPPGAAVDLRWFPGITARHVPLVAAADGTFTVQVPILLGDLLGARVLRATGPGFAPVQVRFLVTRPGLAPPLYAGSG
jgi:uncharacterized repeat protein (TIGR01451 family)